MSNPIQTYSATAASASVTVDFTTAPTKGNAVVVAAFFFLPSVSPFIGINVSDSSGNSYTQDLEKNVATGGTVASGKNYIAVYRTVLANVSSPFSVTFQLSGASGSGLNLDVVCCEVGGLATTQPDQTPSYASIAGSATLTVPSETPTVNDDFALLLFAIGTNDGEWSTPAGWTQLLTNMLSADNVRGEIDCKQLSSASAVGATVPFNDGGTGTGPVTGQGAVLLYRGSGAAGGGLLVLTPSVFIGETRRHGAIVAQSPLPMASPRIAGGVPPPSVFIGQRRRHGVIVAQSPLPMMPAAPMHPLQPTVFIGERRKHGAIGFKTPLLAPPIPGPVPPPITFVGQQRRHRAITFTTPVMPVINPPRIAGGVPAPTVFIGQRRRHRAIVWQTPVMPLAPTETSGTLILLHRGPEADMPIGKNGEPMYGTDTHRLFMGDGFANYFIGGAGSVPATSTSPGKKGEYASDGSFVYYCWKDNNWVRWSASTF